MSTDNSESSESSPEQYFKSYLVLWSSQLISILGSSVVMFVIIWQIGELVGEDNTLLSTAMFLGYLPLVLFSPLAGIFADKFSKKKIIIISDSLQACFTLILIILIGTNQIQIWHLFVINFIRGICQAFHSPAVFALIPIMVPKDKLTRINGLQFLFSNLMNIIGPVIAAMLMVIMRNDIVLWIDIITYAIALAIIVGVKFPKIIPNSVNNSLESEIPDKKENFFRNFLSHFKEGISVISSIPGLFSLLIMAVLSNFFIMPLDTLMLNFIKFEHPGGKTEFAIFSAAFQAGAFTGAIIVSLKKKWKKSFTIIAIGIASLFVCLIILGLIPTGVFWALYVTAFFMILLNPIVNALFHSMVQVRIPPEKMGRVVSVIITLTSFLSPIAMIISGPIADALDDLSGPIADQLGGIRLLYVISGAFGLVISALTILNRKVIGFVNDSEKIMNQEKSEKKE